MAACIYPSILPAWYPPCLIFAGRTGSCERTAVPASFIKLPVRAHHPWRARFFPLCAPPLLGHSCAWEVYGNGASQQGGAGRVIVRCRRPGDVEGNKTRWEMYDSTRGVGRGQGPAQRLQDRLPACLPACLHVYAFPSCSVQPQKLARGYRGSIGKRQVSVISLALRSSPSILLLSCLPCTSRGNIKMEEQLILS